MQKLTKTRDELTTAPRKNVFMRVFNFTLLDKNYNAVHFLLIGTTSRFTKPHLWLLSNRTIATVLLVEVDAMTKIAQTVNCTSKFLSTSKASLTIEKTLEMLPANKKHLFSHC